MIETISIQSIWSPPGKDFPKVITTPEQVKYHLYKDQAELSSHLKVATEATVDWFDTTNRKGEPIRRIQNVIVEGQPVISQAEAQKPPTEISRTDETGKSIEQQVAIKTITELWNTDHLTQDDTEVKACRAWFRDKLASYYEAGGIQAVVKAEVLKESTTQKGLSGVPKLTIDMNWLSESIKKIWGTYKAFVQFLGERYSVAMDGSVKDVLDRLSQPQQADLTKEIEERLNIPS